MKNKFVFACITGLITMIAFGIFLFTSFPTKSNPVITNTNNVRYDIIEIEGMEYAVFNTTRSPNEAIFIVNLTKDKLEIKSLENQLKSR